MAREMKDSGIAWIGTIPLDWKVSRVKNECFNLDYLREPISAEKRDNELGLYDYYGASGVIDKIDRYNVDDTVLLIGEDGANLRMRNLPLVYRASGKFWVNNHAHILKVKPYNEYSYFAYLLESGDYTIHITGTAQPKLSQSNLMGFYIVTPPLIEQKKIGEYLDAQCAEIDAIIEKICSSIEEYKKLKQAIITQAVTKGIRGDRSMKESSVTWVGEIPADWDVAKAKHYVNIQNGSDPKLDGDIPVYGSGADSFKTCGEYKNGPAVLIGRKGATLHIPHYIDGKYWNVDTAFDVHASRDMYLRYYYYCAICFDYKFYISQTTLPGMTQTSYENMLLPIPPFSEQKEISDYLDKKCSEIDAFIEKKEKLLSELEAYKKSLTYEYVTGKRETAI